MSIQKNPNIGGADGDFRSRSSGGLQGLQRPAVKGLNRSVNHAGASKQIPSSDKFLSGKPLSDRSVSVDAGMKLMEQRQQPQHLWSKEQLVSEAGLPKERLGIKISGDYSKIIQMTDACHKDNSADYGGKLERLAELEVKVEKFIGDKTAKNKALSKDQGGRLAGLGRHLAGIKAEKQAAFKGLVSELERPGLKGSETSALIGGVSVNTMSRELHSLDASVRGRVVNTLVKELVGAGRSQEAAQLVTEAFRSGDVSLVTESGRSAANAIMQDVDFNELGGVAQQFYDVGALDAQVVMDVGPELIRRMNMDGIVENQEQADKEIGGINQARFSGTALAGALSEPAISGMRLNAENRSVALRQQQAYVIDKLLSGNSGPALQAMVMSWFQMGDVQTIKAYNDQLPGSDLEVDISKPRFTVEIQKMDAKFFRAITSGQGFDPKSMGWEKLADGWQSQPGADKVSKQAVVHDYLARHAAGLGHIGGGSSLQGE